MKKTLLVASVILLSIVGKEAPSFGFSGIGFSAPNVDGTTNVGNPSVGDIIFDTGSSSFYGYGGTGPGWLLFAGSAPVKAPTIQKFMTVGSSTYTTPTNPAPLYIRVRMVGGGGGGAGGGYDSNLGTGGTGGNTTFGTSLLLGNGGSGGAYYGGTGGTASLGTGPSGVATTGNAGATQRYNYGVNNIGFSGGIGGGSPFGGVGQAGTGGAAGTAAAANSGSGGSGGGMGSTPTATNNSGGGGGGAGGYVDAIITSPALSYPYSIGAGGSAGTAGTNGTAGGAGGSGFIIVEEFYQ